LRRSLLLPAAYLTDQLVGDPEWFPHPVRIIGLAISKGESLLRRPGQTPAYELISGAVLTSATVGATYYAAAKVIATAYDISGACGHAVELLLGWTCLAARNLEQEAGAVTHALMEDDLALARQRVSRIVGRDTAHLDATEISRAVIETVAESASDGILAPLFYMAIGGVPWAVAYKAVNTLDSMIGHADQRYFYFGKAAARLDDAANYLPARITALALIAASGLGPRTHLSSAWRVWRRDARKHKSPNAGQPEAAISGALHVALGGTNTYAGEVIASERMGAEFPSSTTIHARRAIRLVSIASLLAVTLATAAVALHESEWRSR
jgi:adenosylcobinamide-phosphate synthase